MKEHGDTKYHTFDYLELAESADKYFTQAHFMTSVKGAYRIRYEFRMTEMDSWINMQHLNVSNMFNNDGQKLKNGMFYHLKKMGWKSTDIKGRWKKQIFI